MRGRSAGKARLLEGRVRDVVDSGDSVVETGAGVVMVRGGLPGEQVRVRADASRGGVLRGSLIEVLEPSRDRITPLCPVATRCGGCPLMALTPPAQHALKLQRLERALVGAGFELPARLEIAGPELGYRRRARLSFRRLAARTVLGYRESAGHTIVDVDRCAVLEPPLQAALDTLRARLAPVLEGSGELVLTGGGEGGVVVTIACDTPVGAGVYAAAEALASCAPVRGVALRVAGGAPARFGDLDTALLTPDGRTIDAPAEAFAQTNAAVNRRLNELVVELAEPDGARILELYAGHGNFSVELAARAAAFWAVEGNAAAAEACRRNLVERGHRNARVYARDVATFEPEERADVLVLDPPRAGARRLAEIAAAAHVRRVVYVSCHMTTLGRDLKILAARGFQADRAHALEMFPQTAHVEAIVRLQSNHLSRTPSKL